jgi:threonine/homoserine/homoserine lactone efflux protein
MAWQTWLVYLLAAIGLSLTPGPNSLLALTHGALYGHRRTLWTVSGGSVGFVILMALSMLGIGALLKASADLLTLLKLCGGAYLVWLGIQVWRAPALRLDATQGTLRDTRGLALSRQGFLAAVSNPKAILFFAAFLPQFIDVAKPLLPQFLVMAATFGAIEFLVEYLLARLANGIRPRLERAGTRFNRACGALFAIMGVALPLSR